MRAMFADHTGTSTNQPREQVSVPKMEYSVRFYLSAAEQGYSLARWLISVHNE